MLPPGNRWCRNIVAALLGPAYLFFDGLLVAGVFDAFNRRLAPGAHYLSGGKAHDGSIFQAHKVAAVGDRDAVPDGGRIETQLL